MTEFKDMLAYLRKRENLSQAELAKILHVSTGTIGMYESGKRYPIREIEEAIADYFNINLETLRGNVTESPKFSGENSDLLAKIFNDGNMLMYIKKIYRLSDANKEVLFKYIDFLAASDKN